MMRMLLFLALVGCASQTASVARAPNYTVDPDSTGLVDLEQFRVDRDWANDPSPRDIQNVVQLNSQTVAGFLRHLRDRFPSYFEGYSLAYESFSIQEASYQNPRALVFGNSGRTILTFNGTSSQRGFGAIEMMSYEPSLGFQFREIAFMRDGGSDYLSPDEIDERLSSRDIKVSKPNIAKCTQCHGETNPRPIFETYFTWPGFYGGDDDSVFRSAGSSAGLPTESLRRLMKTIHNDPERENLIKFIGAGKEQNSRYRLLGNYIRRVMGPTAESSKQVMYSIAKQGYGGVIGEPEVRPNLILMTHLMRMSSHRAAQILSAKQEFSAWKYALTAGAACGEIGEGQFAFIPSPLRDRLGNLDAATAEIRAEEYRDNYEKLKRVERLYGKSAFIWPEGAPLEVHPGRNELAEIKQVIPGITEGEAYAVFSGFSRFKTRAQTELIFKSLGYSLADWSINLRRTKSLDDGFNEMALFYQFALAAKDQDPYFFGSPWGTYVAKHLAWDKVCEEGRTKSLEALSGL